jgi:phosphatidylserine/phosphatidylglycerophosphate/cardiolipin synthase-like enzyme
VTRVLPVFLVLAACAPDADWDEAEWEGSAEWAESVARGGAEAPSAQIWFTAPGTSAATGIDPELDDALIAAIGATTATLDIAVFEFNRRNISDAVVAAAARGVRVRMVGDGDEVTDEGYVALAAAGIPIVNRRPRDRIMHNKFAVMDGRFVWTGSTNWSDNDVLRNNNNALLIDSPQLAERFTREFLEMWAGRFGTAKTANPSGRSFPWGDREAGIYFMPKDDPISEFIDAIASANHTIEFLAFSFTDGAIATALEQAKARGVAVVGILDDLNARNAYSVDERLARAGLATFIDGNGNASGIVGGKLHHKVMIIDANTRSDPRVLVGSFNWSENATKYNDENLLSLPDPAIAALYHQEFCADLAVARPHPEFQGTVPPTCKDPRDQVFLNEVQPDPSGPDVGQEYVEIVNTSLFAVDLSGWKLGDLQDPARHVFGQTFIDPGKAVVVYDQGDHSTIPGAINSTTGSLSLNNKTDSVTLTDPTGTIRDRLDYGAVKPGVAWNRNPDGTKGAPWAFHDTIQGAAGGASPGRSWDGSAWGEDTVEVPIHLLINEVMADPTGAEATREVVEIVNVGANPADLTGWTLGDQTSRTRHVFGAVSLQPGRAILVWDSGTHSEAPVSVVASSGQLNLTNTGDVVQLYDALGRLHDQASYPAGTEGVSWNRNPDGAAGAPMAPHNTVQPGANQSAGTRSGGGAW